VAGVAAALLSVRRELIGRPGDVKDALLGTATDLHRQATYQGRGLVNLMAALALQPTVQPTVSAAQRSAAPGWVAPAAAAPPPARDRAAPPPVATEQLQLKLMCSYAHKDALLWDELRTHLSPLRREGILATWYDRQILAGDEWRAEIAREMEIADIILLLVSADFVASEFCYDVELRRALERHESRQARVVPVIVRPVDWSKTPFAKLQALPRDGRPVTLWQNQDEAWLDVATGIRRIVETRRET
jgi:hypothetical protein